MNQAGSWLSTPVKLWLHLIVNFSLCLWRNLLNLAKPNCIVLFLICLACVNLLYSPLSTSGECDFESPNLCNFTQDEGDIFDWSRGSGNTISVGTGPSYDHTYKTASGKLAIHVFESAKCIYLRLCNCWELQDLYTIHSIETNAAIFKQQRTVHEITTCVQNHQQRRLPTLTEEYLVERSELHGRNFRDSSLIDGIRTKSATGKCSFKSAAAREWNFLPCNIRNTPTLRTL